MLSYHYISNRLFSQHKRIVCVVKARRRQKQ